MNSKTTSRVGRTFRPAMVEVHGEAFEVHADGSVYRRTGRGLRRVRDMPTMMAVAQVLQRQEDQA